MAIMTKEEARLFKERWRLVNEITNEEARRAPVSHRVRDLEVLYQFARAIDRPDQDEDEEEVRNRWNRLREKAGV